MNQMHQTDYISKSYVYIERFKNVLSSNSAEP